MAFAPPTRLHLWDKQGRFFWRPFVCRYVPLPSGYTFTEYCGQTYPITWFVSGQPYRLAWVVELRTHLFGVQHPGAFHLMGTDEYGRDQFSRFLFGGRISLFAGILACCISLSLGAILGVAAGFYGRWVDSCVMGLAEISMALPWLYLLFGVRAFLPLNTPRGPHFCRLLCSLASSVGHGPPGSYVGSC
jgi:peptide/nickel transport system permease protein